MIETGSGRGHHERVHPGVPGLYATVQVSLPFGWPGESGADPRSFTIARSYPGYGRAPPETKDGHPSSQAYSPAIRLNAEIRRHQHTIPDEASPFRDDGGGDPL